MAIKGKKKSQRRGSQGVRRPAAAPRPAPAPRRKRAWYRTREGMLVGGVFLLVLLGLVIWGIVSAQERAQEEAASRDAIDTYTTQLRSALEGATEPVTNMTLVGTTPRGDDLEELGDNTQTWIEQLQAAQAEVVQIFPDRELEPVNQLFNEALSFQVSAAQTFALLPDVSGETRQQLFARAADQRDTANALWSSAIGVLDQMRRDRGLSASGMRAPAPGPGEMPAPGGEEMPLDEIPLDEMPLEDEAPADDGTGEGAEELDDGTGDGGDGGDGGG